MRLAQNRRSPPRLHRFDAWRRDEGSKRGEFRVSASVWSLSASRFARPGGPLAPSAPGFPRAAPRFDLDIAPIGLDPALAEEEEWRRLAGDALEPNAFFEPGFALSAARHFPLSARPVFVGMWRRGGFSQQRRLIALFPLSRARAFLGGGLERLWLHDNAALATPLIDRRGGEEALAAWLDWLGEASPAPGVVFPKIVKSGPLHDLVAATARATGRRLRLLDDYERAALYPGSDVETLWRRNSSLHSYKEFNRRRRRLEENGPVETSWAATPDDVRLAMEQFLALEAAGWKGGRGALLSDPGRATFARSAARLLAREGKCKILSLDAGGRRLAMGIVLESGRRAAFWKIAFDESARSFAPGIHLVHALTRAHLARNDLDLTDSCAIANHPMIDRFWPDRLGICDLAIETRPGGAAFDSACAQDRLRRRLRAGAKDAVNGLLRRKTS
jgi:CelD/BcsL family acetyltransferase involved in cellulose biosynthesis